MAILREQKSRHDCGPTCVANLLNLLGYNISIKRINKICKLKIEGTDSDNLIGGFEKYNFKAKERVYHNPNKAMSWLMKVTNNGTPAIVSVDNDTHWLLVLLAGKKFVQILDPENKYPVLMNKNDFLYRWSYLKSHRNTPILHGIEVIPDGIKAIGAVKMRAALIATSDVK